MFRGYKMDKYEHQYVFDIITAQMERTIKRLWILCILLVVLLVGSNIAWFVYESQFETVSQVTTQEVQQDNDNGNNIMVGRDYGKADN